MVNILLIFGLGEAASAALISGAASAVSTGSQVAGNAAKNKKQRRWQNEDWHKRSVDQWAMWTANNNYNHPREQMKRFREAGLNPNLIYGSAANGGMSSPVQKPSADTPQYTPLTEGTNSGDLFAGFANIAQQRLGIKQQEALIKKLNADTLKILAEVDQKNMDIEQKKQYQKELHQALQIQGDYYGESPTQSEAMYKVQKDLNLDKQSMAQYRKIEAEIKKLNDEAALNDFYVELAKLLKVITNPTIKQIGNIAKEVQSKYNN